MADKVIIIKPLVTEKSNDQMQVVCGVKSGICHKKYTFLVNVKATKIEIRKEVEKLFNVKVLAVSTMNYKGKKKRMGVHVGYRSDWKKAIVKIDAEPKESTYMTDKGVKVSTGKKKNSISDIDAVN